jgi:hypothetical protein
MKAIDISGQKFGRLTVVESVGSKKGEGVLWLCSCECGGEIFSTGKPLKSGNTKSCGCIAKELIVARNKASSKHNMTGSSTFISWDSMKQRCLNPNHKSFSHYGEKGVVICARCLESFDNFLFDMGVRHAGTTLDRIDSSGNYEPGNCRWATDELQGNNKQSNRLITHEGRCQTIAQWAREIGMSRQSLRHRLENGWSIKEALTMKLNYGNGWERGVRA